MATVVPIESISLHNGTNSKRSVRTMMEVLKKQGQIEPLQVRKHIPKSGPPFYTTFNEDVHGEDIVRAAQELEWPTILITVERKYIP
jgi:hypothetical protein